MNATLAARTARLAWSLDRRCRHEAGNRLAGLGNDHFLALNDAFQQPGEVGLGSMNVDGGHGRSAQQSRWTRLQTKSGRVQGRCKPAHEFLRDWRETMYTSSLLAMWLQLDRALLRPAVWEHIVALL